MAISYPITTPAISRFASVVFTPNDAIAEDGSPFTFEKSFQDWGGQKWLAEVQLPTMNAACSSDWEAFLTACRGKFGTFLLGDPARSEPRGTATAASITGAVGSATVSVTMTGTLLAGDMLQIGSGLDARLYKVLVDQSGNGSLEIWPSLRVAATSATAVLSNPKGVFRLVDNSRGWAISNFRWRRIAFMAEEAI
jgi:hypothetical protein